MDIAPIRALVADDMHAVDEFILRRMGSDVPLINEIGRHIVQSGGKRIRPMLVLLAARSAGYQGRRHIDLAAIIEFIHTATLLHDDVVDNSEKRRHLKTANAIWGNSASVLVGDFLYSRSFEMMVDVGHMGVMEILSHATNRIAEGEVLQLLHCKNPKATQEDYFEVIHRKTATLFQAGAHLGAVIAEVPREVEQALAGYGLHLGTAYQLIDDVLDYSADEQTLGKNIGDDLAEGKLTLPLIRALEIGSSSQQQTLLDAVTKADRHNIGRILDIIASTDGITYTAQLAAQEGAAARAVLEILPPSAYRSALMDLADFTIQRSY